MIFREAHTDDIFSIQRVRHSVRENKLSDPSLVPDKDVEDFITRRGKGWVCEINNRIVGFAIADLQDNNVWALFVDPDFEKMGIGKKLHKRMLNWYFDQQKENIWLGTAPGTRAAEFYRMQGWKENGLHGNKEIKFEMTRETWLGLSWLKK